ncbi:FUSC family protein [Frankia sp. AgB32]|uniref:FUSC family protein n=1 Tax=Frankia sp. AgB32 TaxID=631119 RepID=UPI00200E33EA|nr:FUSC family protein [Frankia sp. AgB32]MCK9894114.1 FUSC family protein [Frankia sp. AgB32]
MANILPARQRLEAWPAVAGTIGAALGTFATVLLLRTVVGVGSAAAVLGVVLVLTLSRVRRGRPVRARHQRLLPLVVTPLIALLASEVGRLTERHRNAGEALFVLAISGAVWIRRFGPVWARAGTLATLPFIALIVTPVPPGSGAMSQLALVGVAFVAVGWVTLASQVETWLGVPAPSVPVDPVDHGAAGAQRRPQVAGRRRLAASSRMAAQLAVALAAAFVLGRHLFPAHRTWLVLTAYLVNSGNRGRADVLYRSVQRFAGAAAGTAAASLLAGVLPTHDRWSLVAVFGLLALGVWLRPVSYAYWAACITGVLALLYGYYGQSGAGLLRERLAAVGLGAALGLGAAWFVLPVRTSGVLRRRVADLLAALTDYLIVIQTGRRRGAGGPTPPAGAGRAGGPAGRAGAGGTNGAEGAEGAAAQLRRALAEAHGRVEAAFDRLAEIAPPLRAQRTLARLARAIPPGQRDRTRAPQRYDVVEALLACRTPVRELTGELARRGTPPPRSGRREIARVRDRVVASRRALAAASGVRTRR